MLDNGIACVSGASGIVGRRICEQLIAKGYKVRALSRQGYLPVKNVELFKGDILNKDNVRAFMKNARLFFHCAAELKNELRMWEVNVHGTENVLKYAEEISLKYFCYLSSVGVIGNTNLKLVDELTPCNPQNAYEKSKLAAEQLVVTKKNEGCKVVILRPTNIIDKIKPGILTIPQRGSFMDLVAVFVKGAECAHIVHAEDVAAAALHFISYPQNTVTVQSYIVSCDHEPMNTLSGLWVLYKAFQENKPIDNLRLAPHLPLWVPYVLRKIVRGPINKGDICYSSKKLMETGFIFNFGVKGTVKQIALTADTVLA